MVDRIPVSSITMNGLDVGIYQLTSLEFSKGDHLIVTFKNNEWEIIDQDGDVFDYEFIKDLLIEHINKTTHKDVDKSSTDFVRYFELQELDNE